MGRRAREPLAYEVDNYEVYRKQAIIAAKELGYGRSVIDKLELAETEAEVTRIMNSARKRFFDKIDATDISALQRKKTTSVA